MFRTAKTQDTWLIDISSALLYFGANSTAIRRHNGHQYFFYKVQNYTIDGRAVFKDQSVVCLWPKQDYIVFIVLLNFPVMIWSLYHKLLCGNLFLFPIVFFSLLYQKKHTLSIQEFLTLFLHYHHSHTTRLTTNWFWLQDWFIKL